MKNIIRKKFKSINFAHSARNIRYKIYNECGCYSLSFTALIITSYFKMNVSVNYVLKTCSNDLHNFAGMLQQKDRPSNKYIKKTKNLCDCL